MEIGGWLFIQFLGKALNNTMKKIYYTLFAKLYRFFSLYEKDVPNFYSMALMSLLLYFNVSTIISLLEVYLYPNFHDKISIFAGIGILIMNYFIFLHRGRYVAIIEEYKPSNKLINKIFSVVIILIYIILSIYLWVISGFHVRALNLR